MEPIEKNWVNVQRLEKVEKGRVGNRIEGLFDVYEDAKNRGVIFK